MAVKPDKDEAANMDELHEIRVRRDSPTQGMRDAFLELKNKLSDRIREELRLTGDIDHPAQLRSYAHDRIDALLEEQGIVANRSERRLLLEAIVAELIHPPS